MLTHFSLFSGIGGIDLAAEWAGFESVGQCEWADYPTKVLEKHWPDVPRWRDVRDVTLESVREVMYMTNHRKDYDHAIELYDKGISIQEVANFYQVSRQSMWMILKRRSVKFRDNKKFGVENHFYRGTKADGYSQNLLEQAIEDGIIARQTKCQECGHEGTFSDGRTAIQAHHTDYNKPINVIWLCQKCHHEWHKHNAAIERMVMPSEAMPRTTIDVLSGGFP